MPPSVGRDARDHRALERHGVRDALGHRGALLLGRAQRGDAAREPAARRALGLEQRAQRQQVVGQRLEQARALAAELVAAQRPRELAGARRAAGHQRDERAQLVLGRPRRPSSTPCGRPPVPRSPSDHGPAPIRSHATGASATRAGSNSRSALSSRRKRMRASVIGAGDRRIAGQRQAREHARLVGADAPHGVGRRARRARRRARATAPRRARSRRDDPQAEHAAPRRPRRSSPRTARPRSRVGALQALGRDDELRRLAEDAADEDAQRRSARSRGSSGIRGSPCSRR